MGAEILAAGVIAASATTVGILNYTAAQDAAGAQKKLADEQAQRLKTEQANAAAEAAKAAGTGATFGFTETSDKTLLTGFGFGGAPKSTSNSGRSQITGLD